MGNPDTNRAPTILRLVLFAHFDENDRIKPYVLHYLRALRSECSRLVFVSTSALPGSETCRLDGLVDQVLLKENVGFDFGMWRHALERVSWADCDEILVTNSGIVGPVHPLGPIFERMSGEPCDFWGMTDTQEITWHLQSYFLVFRRALIRSPHFTAFWNSVLPFRRKGSVVLAYEMGLTAYFEDYGFRPGALTRANAWASPTILRRMERTGQFNPTLFYPLEILAAGMPFVKVELLRNNIAEVDLAAVREAMRRAGFDLALLDGIVGGPRPPARLAEWRRRARRVVPELVVEAVRRLVDELR
jgi:rhamnosyltransferase